MIGALGLGQSALTPPGTFDPTVVSVAVVIHMVLAIIYRVILAFIIMRLPTAWDVLAGVVYGLALYYINFYGFSGASMVRRRARLGEHSHPTNAKHSKQTIQCSAKFDRHTSLKDFLASCCATLPVWENPPANLAIWYIYEYLVMGAKRCCYNP